METSQYISDCNKLLDLGPEQVTQTLPQPNITTEAYNNNDEVQVNKLLDKMELTENVYYVDISYLFLEHDETISKHIMYDYLHLTREGYRILTEHISKLLFIFLDNVAIISE